jgi:nucleotide-binding universal stress UspA family protein
MSMAQENQARLILLHVVPGPEKQPAEKIPESAVADAMRRLHELVPAEAELWCRPEALVQYGKPAEQILETAKEHGVDLIVLGVRYAGGHIGVATHVQRTTAHRVVAHAMCPVLTVCG